MSARLVEVDAQAGSAPITVECAVDGRDVELRRLWVRICRGERIEITRMIPQLDPADREEIESLARREARECREDEERDALWPPSQQEDY